MINQNNFINININYIKEYSSLSTRPVTVLLDDSTTGSIQPKDINDKYYKSLDEFVADIENSDTDTSYASGQLYKMVALYFKNGGQQLHYIKYSEASGTNTSEGKIKSLNSDEIIVTGCFTDRTKLISIATSINKSLTGIDEKFFIISKDASTINTQPTALNNLAIKIGSAGIEMTIAAYLSKINIDTSTIQDYCFTNEYLGDSNNEVLYINDVIDDNSVFVSIKEKNIYNVDIKCIASIRNYGGNTANQQDLVNYYVKIILCQTLTDKLLNLLMQKLKYSTSSLALVSATIINELNRYKRAGYISTDKTWDKGDQYDASNTYLVLANNTPLTLGYSFSILPLSSLTADDKAAHKLPEIYVFIADTYSIRQITFTGNIF